MSPDIFCFQGTWYQMLPVTLLLYAFFGVYIIIVLLQKRFLDAKIAKTQQHYLSQDEQKEVPTNEFAEARERRRLATLWKKDEQLATQVTNFNQMFQYVFRRFQKRYFYYEFIVLLRKLVLSLLYIFLQPMLVLVFAVFVLMISLLIHLKLMLYKLKCKLI
jgi:hypothetical protein